MKKKLIIFALIFIVSVSFIFADSDDATLTIQGYKNPDLPTDGTLKLYVYNTMSSQSSTTEVSGDLDVTSSLSTYISAFTDIFSIKLQTNLKSNVSLSVKFSPFISQDKNKNVISTSYYLKASGTDYTNNYNTESSYSGWGGSSSTYYFIKHSPSISITPTGFTNSSSGYTVSVDEDEKATTATAEIVQTITSTYGTASRNSADSVRKWRTYSNQTSSETLENIATDGTVDSMIYVKMKLNTTLNAIFANVNYQAPVIITVSVE